jgi:hypothetical protein
MNKEEYILWYRNDPANMKGRYLKSSVNPFIIMGIPIGREDDVWIEGFVIWSQYGNMPVGYHSNAWNGYVFDSVEGELDFKSSAIEPPYLLQTEIVKKFNPNYPQDTECVCGHPYYRHFDGYDGNEPVGCKYCACYEFIARTAETERIAKEIEDDRNAMEAEWAKKEECNCFDEY